MPDWASVTTVHAPAWLIRLHAAYLRLAGAATSIYFIDRPDSFSEGELTQLSQLATVIRCDDAYWEGHGGRPETVPHRQSKNMAHARSVIPARWFFHLDIDEFPYVPLGIDRIVGGVPGEVGEIRLQNVERLIIRGSRHWHDGVLRIPNFDQALQLRHYGARSRFLGLGLAHYFHGKSLVANRPQLVQDVHGAVHITGRREVVRVSLDKSEGFVVHYPCISPQHFAGRQRRHGQQSGPRERRFRHEHLFDQFVTRHGIGQEDAVKAMLMMHTCTADEAQSWVEAGLCRQVPDAYLDLMMSAAGGEPVLDLAFANETFKAFYRAA